MDISFHTEEGRFNYRVCAVLVKGGRLLIMKDDALPYYYLPGGRVKLRETAEEALVREMSEELGAAVRPVRPLWLNQAFFTEDVTKEFYHEICLYYLAEAEGLPEDGFSRKEDGKKLSFESAELESLGKKYLYPEFIKEKISDLPQRLEITSEYRR